MLFLWIGSQNDRMFCLEEAIGLLTMAQLEQNAEFVSLAALSW